MMATVWPGRAVKETSFRASSSASGYRKETFRNSTSPDALERPTLAAPSAMPGSVDRTSRMRRQATRALGMKMKTKASIMNAPTICRAYAEKTIICEKSVRRSAPVAASIMTAPRT